MDPLADFLLHLTNSFERWTGKPLVSEEIAAATKLRESLDRADFALLAHGTEPDPILCYGNTVALRLWEMSWAEFTSMPSRLTAEPDCREDRARILHNVMEKGYADGYQGIRISRSGRRFRIHNASVWNILDHRGERIGQAAMFTGWTCMDS